jgi:RimJ/RimL family protein N-acetyltransferase
MLIEADDAAFAALAAGEAPGTLRLVEGGLETPEIMAMLRNLAATVGAQFRPSAWMIVEASEVVGLCSLKTPPDATGAVDIGYGVSAARRGRGIASRAVADVLAWARQDSAINRVTAETSVANIASQRVLERNGFVLLATRHDDEDGELFCWQKQTP